MTRLALVLVLLLISTVGYAAAPDRCQTDHVCAELSEKASQLVAQRRYEEALQLYQGAYDVAHEPLLLINIGRCHYRMGRARKAIEFYTSYTRAVPDSDPAVRARVEQWQVEAQQAIRADAERPESAPAKRADAERPESAPAKGADAERPESAPAKKVPEPPLVASPDKGQAPPKSRRPRSSVRLGLGISALGLGVTLIGLGGGALGADGSCVTPSSSAPGRCTPEVAPDGTQVATLIDGKGAGAALLATGGLFVIGGVLLITLPGRRAAE